MSTEPTDPPQAASWGDAPPAAEPGTKPGWTGRKTAVAVGVAVLIAGGGGVAIAVGAGGEDAAAGPGGRGGPGSGRMPGGFQGGPPGGLPGGETGALRTALHGDFVVADGSGGYTTQRLQTGDVSELGATSLTLTSKDGYRQVYTIDSATRKSGEPKTGESVTVVAKVAGDTATATTVAPATATGTPPEGQRGTQRPGGS